MNASIDNSIRHNWSKKEVQALFALPFNDLLFQAQVVHRQHFNPNEVQVSTLCSIKTGKCPEDCAYCPQSNRYDTGLEYEDLMEVQAVIDEAKAAKEKGSTRFCMGAACAVCVTSMISARPIVNANCICAGLPAFVTAFDAQHCVVGQTTV